MATAHDPRQSKYVEIGRKYKGRKKTTESFRIANFVSKLLPRRLTTTRYPNMPGFFTRLSKIAVQERIQQAKWSGFEAGYAQAREELKKNLHEYIEEENFGK